MWATQNGSKPQPAVRHLWLSGRSFVSVPPPPTGTSASGSGSSADSVHTVSLAALATISAQTVTVSSGAVLGCLPCPRSVDVQNGLPGCSVGGADTTAVAPPPLRGILQCPPTLVTAKDYLRMVSGGQALGVLLNLTAGNQITVDASAKVSTSDYLAESEVVLEAALIRIGGLVRASTVQLLARTVLVAETGEVSAEAMGSGGGLGPSAGETHPMGGGGGGYGGRGAQGCFLGSRGGEVLVTDDVASPWRFGSGGGHGGGNSKARGGRGGGRIRISSQNLTVHGRVTADGASTECVGAVRSFYAGNRVDKEFVAGAHSGGGGAGGSIWISSDQVFGSGGLHARGGSARGNCHLAWPGGGGGGGRIAVIVAQQEVIDLAAFAGIDVFRCLQHASTHESFNRGLSVLYACACASMRASVSPSVCVVYVEHSDAYF